MIEKRTTKPRRTSVEVSLVDDLTRALGALEAQASELVKLRATVELQARQIEYLRARVSSMTDDCGIWAEGWPAE